MNIDLDEETKPDTPKHHWLHWRPTKKQTLIGLAVLVVVGVAAGSWLLLQNHNKTSSVAMVGASGAKSNTVAVLEGVLDEVTLEQVVSGKLPAQVVRLVTCPGAWEPH